MCGTDSVCSVISISETKWNLRHLQGSQCEMNAGRETGKTL